MIVIWEMHAIIIGLSRWLSGKESACQAGDTGSIPGSGRCPGEGNGNPLQYICWENPMDRGAWQATVHGVTKETVTKQQHSIFIHTIILSGLAI